MRKTCRAVYLVPFISIMFATTACGPGQTQGAASASVAVTSTVPQTTSTSTSTTSTSTSTTTSTTTTTTSPPTTTTKSPWVREILARPENPPGCIPQSGNSKSSVQLGAKPWVALTIDDFQRPEDIDYLSQLLDITAVSGTKLTIFPTGKGLQLSIIAGKQEVWRRAIREGHIIGNHTYDHASLPGTGESIRNQLQRQQDKLNEVLGYEYPEIFMRPPGGNGALGCRVASDVGRISKEMSLIPAVWTIDSNGTGGNADLRSQILATKPLGNGAIILLHPQTFSIENFAPLIQGLLDKGYELVTLNQMLGLSPCAPITCEPPTG